MVTVAPSATEPERAVAGPRPGTSGEHPAAVRVDHPLVEAERAVVVQAAAGTGPGRPVPRPALVRGGAVGQYPLADVVAGDRHVRAVLPEPEVDVPAAGGSAAGDVGAGVAQDGALADAGAVDGDAVPQVVVVGRVAPVVNHPDPPLTHRVRRSGPGGADHLVTTGQVDRAVRRLGSTPAVWATGERPRLAHTERQGHSGPVVPARVHRGGGGGEHALLLACHQGRLGGQRTEGGLAVEGDPPPGGLGPGDEDRTGRVGVLLSGRERDGGAERPPAAGAADGDPGLRLRVGGGQLGGAEQFGGHRSGERGGHGRGGGAGGGPDQARDHQQGRGDAAGQSSTVSHRALTFDWGLGPA